MVVPDNGQIVQLVEELYYGLLEYDNSDKWNSEQKFKIPLLWITKRIKVNEKEEKENETKSSSIIAKYYDG